MKIQMLAAALSVAPIAGVSASEASKPQIAPTDLCQNVAAMAKYIAIERQAGITPENLSERLESSLDDKPSGVSVSKEAVITLGKGLIQNVYSLDPVLFTPDRVGKLYYLNCIQASKS